MKKYILFVLCMIMILVLSSCSYLKKTNIGEPELAAIRDICKLSTLECYYHNVAKLEKSGETGILGITTKSSRQLWIEYTGVVKIGIDFADVSMEIDGNKVLIYMPEAEYIDMYILEETLTPDSFHISKDKSSLWYENKITPEDQRNAITEAQQKMKDDVMANKSLLLNAKQRAQELIEKYITNLGEACGITYNVIFEDVYE